jgi:diguanylate cyclase (GGDEF)-like protein/PAS domain S-box-containing protein
MYGRESARLTSGAFGTAELLSAAEEVAGIGAFEHDLETDEVEFSPGLLRILAAPRHLSRRDLLGRLESRDRELLTTAIVQAKGQGKPFSLELRLLRFDGAQRTMLVRGKVFRHGDRRCLIGTVQDVTEEVEARAARDLLSYVVDSTDDAIITKASDGTVTSWNRGAERLYGYSATEALGRPISIIEPPELAGEQEEITRKVFSGESVDHYQTERVRKDGERITVLLTISPVRDANGQIVLAAVIARDITERVRHEARLRHLADHDQLTGLFNRRRFDEELKRELARAGRFDARGALLNIDLDNFKSINDRAGHAAGDRVLQTVASVLRKRFRASDVVARLGGDEFCVLLCGAGLAEARAAADDLLRELRRARPAFGGKTLDITASIGVACFDSDDVTAGELLIAADVAMYSAKAEGRDAVRVYDDVHPRTPGAGEALVSAPAEASSRPARAGRNR